MTVLTIHEQQEIDRANNSGLQPVVFVHGLWLLSSSWDRWRALFEEQGYTTLAPGWPDDPQTVEEANDDSEVFAHKRLKQVTDHYIDAIRQLKRKPAVIGHSFGGPLLLHAGEEDHTVALAVVSAAYQLQQHNPAVTEFRAIPNRGHSLVIDHGWRDVAEIALAFIAQQLSIG